MRSFLAGKRTFERQRCTTSHSACAFRGALSCPNETATISSCVERPPSSATPQPASFREPRRFSVTPVGGRRRKFNDDGRYARVGLQGQGQSVETPGVERCRCVVRPPHVVADRTGLSTASRPRSTVDSEDRAVHELLLLRRRAHVSVRL